MVFDLPAAEFHLILTFTPAQELSCITINKYLEIHVASNSGSQSQHPAWNLTQSVLSNKKQMKELPFYSTLVCWGLGHCNR